jgi:O-acetyl-ADP-ribose deacetylase (regulator of RNase III)
VPGYHIAGHFYFCGMSDVSSKMEVIRGDITKQKVDAIVNAANSSLMGGGGVDGAIHRAGGAAILEQCKQIIGRQGSCPTGEAVITTAGNLPAKFVIHTVGPIWQGGKNNEPEKLSSCYRNSLLLAAENNLKTIAFPNISTGIYGYPREQAAHVAVKTVTEYLESDFFIVKVHFLCFDEENFQLYRSLLK